MKIELSTRDLETCIIALRQAFGSEQSFTARLRIAKTLKTLELTLQADYSRTEDFTHDELFPDALGVTTTMCRECGAHVPVIGQDKHVKFHNKLLP